MVFWKWKEKCKEVEGELNVMREDRDDYKHLYDSVSDERSKLESMNKELNREISRLKDKIEDMQGELDILNGHYKLDIAEDEESRLQVKRDVRVYHLELENMELRRTLEDVRRRLVLELESNLYRSQAIYSTMLCNLNTMNSKEIGW